MPLLWISIQNYLNFWKPPSDGGEIKIFEIELCSRSACLAEFTAQSPAWHSRIRAFPMVQSIQIWAHPPRPSHTHTIWSGFAPMILSVTAGALLHSQVHTPPPHTHHTCTLSLKVASSIFLDYANYPCTQPWVVSRAPVVESKTS
jgi:hypothetical protein